MMKVFNSFNELHASQAEADRVITQNSPDGVFPEKLTKVTQFVFMRMRKPGFRSFDLLATDVSPDENGKVPNSKPFVVGTFDTDMEAIAFLTKMRNEMEVPFNANEAITLNRNEE